MTTAGGDDDINSILWRACDTFRGTVDPTEYTSYILVMLFVEHVSDVWRDHREHFREQYRGDEGRIACGMRYEKFRLPDGCDFLSLYEQRKADNLGEIINIALDAIEDANIEKFEGVFRNIDFNSEANLRHILERNDRLRNLLNDFRTPRLDLRPLTVGDGDIIGDAHEFLIGQFAPGAGKGVQRSASLDRR